MGQRKKYDKAFKEQVVLRILANESTIGESAAELGVHYTTVRDWVKYYKRDGANASLAAVISISSVDVSEISCLPNMRE